MQKGAKLGSSTGTCQIFPSQTFQTLNISSLSTKAEFGQRLIYISTLGLYIDDRDRYGYTCHKPFWQRDNFVHQAPPTCVGLLSACCQWLVHTQKRLEEKYLCVGHHATEDSPWSAAVMPYSTKLWLRVEISGECKHFNSRVTISSI